MATLALARPRPIFCVTEHAYRDVSTAQAVSAGRFTHLGVTRALGLPPDWMAADLPEDKEWRIEWSKFYYGLDLAHAFSVSREIRFLHAWEQLVDSWTRQVPADFDRSDVIGRRIQNWIYAWNRFADADAFSGFSDPTRAERLVFSIGEQVRHLRGHLTAERNHRTFELYALLVAGLALPELDPRGELVDFAIDELNRNLLMDVRADGVHREASTHYHMVALRTFLGARENARRFGRAFPDSYDRRLEAACDFALHVHRPDGSIPAFSDSDTGRYQDLLVLAGEILGRPDFVYAGTAGARGVPPTRRCVTFPEGGYSVTRSGWGTHGTAFTDERFLLFDHGPLGDGGHGHYDLLSIEASAHGEPLIMDPGRYTYSDAPPDWRRWFKGTAAHNTVCVDGKDQTPYQRGKPKGAVATARLISHRSAPGFDVIEAEAQSPAYEAVHRRRIVFVNDEYWIVADDLTDTQPHVYDLRFHLAPSAQDRAQLVRSNGGVIVTAPNLTLLVAPGGDATLELGWISPLYGTRYPAPVLSVKRRGCAESFASLIYPGSCGEARVRQTVDGARIVLEAHVQSHGRAVIDTVTLSQEEHEAAAGGSTRQARASWARTDARGRLLACAGVNEGTYFAWSPESGARQGDSNAL